MLSVDRRPSIIAPRDGSLTPSLTLLLPTGERYIVTGRQALEDYGRLAPTNETGTILFHGTYKSPDEIGNVLQPQQSYSRRGGKAPQPHGKPAISTSNTPDFPLARAFFREQAPAFQDYPDGELIFADRGDKIDTHYMMVTKDGLASVRDANPTAYVNVLHERQEGIKVQPFREMDGRTYEYRISTDAIPQFVMPVTVEDLPPTLMVVPDTATARRILDNLPGVDPSYFASEGIENIYGDPYWPATVYV